MAHNSNRGTSPLKAASPSARPSQRFILTSNRWSILFAVVLSCLVLVDVPTACAQNEKPALVSDIYDVFPLQVGSVWTYEFRYYSGSSDFNYENSVGDSGYYSYQIVDSSMTDDSTVSWEVLEHTEITRHVYKSAWGWAFVDSTFLIDTTAAFMLTERMTGDHELTCSSRVWSFPLNGHYGVFRYALTPEAVVSGHCLGALFSVDSGYFYGHSDPYCDIYDWSGGGWIREYTTTRLIAKSVTDASDDLPLPSTVSLQQNYPNPFNPVTVIEFALPAREFVSLKIFNLLGERVATFLEGELPPGVQRVRWDATGCPSGVYVYRLQAGSHQQSRKLVLAR